MIDEDAKGTRHQGENQSLDDAEVRYKVLQTSKALAEDIEQQRHQTQGCDGGAGGHYDAGRVQDRRSIIRLMYLYCYMSDGPDKALGRTSLPISSLQL